MIIAMPKVLVDKLGSEGADALVHVLNDVDTMTKTDLATKGDLSVLKSELKSEMSTMKNELLKWMFLFWIGQAATVIGILMTFMAKVRP